MARFVGREVAVAVLASARAAADRGEPRLVIVEGPAGIGKTTFVRHALDAAGEGAGGVHAVTAWQSESLVPFGVLDQLLRRVGGRPVGSEPGAVDVADAGGCLLATLSSGDGAVVLVVDDAQWADASSLQALAFAFRRLEADRVLIVLCTRGPVDADAVLARLGQDPRAHRIVLEPLSTLEVQELALRFGTPLSPAASARLRDHTAGLPLYLTALLEELDATTLARTTGALPAPRSFATVILQRVSSAPPGVESLVSAVAVCGDRAPVTVAAAAAGVEDPVAAIDHAVALGLLEHRRSGPGDELRFVHSLVRAAVLDALAPGRKAEMHRRVAEQLTGVAALEHRAAAALMPDAQLAEELHGAANDDITRGATDLGAQRLLEAARLQPDSGIAREWRLDALGALAWGGALASANELADELSEDIASDDPRVLYLRGHFALLNGQRSECERLLLLGWDRCDPIMDPALASLIATRLAQLYTIFGPEPAVGEALEWAERSFQLVPADDGVLRAPNGIVLVSLALSGRPGEALDRALPEDATTEVLSRGVRRDTLDNGFDFVLGRGIVKLWTDNLTGARVDLRTAASPTGAIVVPAIWTRLWALGFLVDLEYRAGNWDDSVAIAEQAISLARDTDHRWVLGLLHGVAALPTAARGDWDAATEHVDAARAIAAVLDSTVSVAFAAAAGVSLAAARGDDDAVIAATDVLVQMEEGRGAMEPGVLQWCALRVEALTRVGRVDEAVALSDEALAVATQRRRASALGSGYRARGVLEEARGDPEAAAQAFTRADAEARRVAMPYTKALLDLAHGGFLRRLGKRRAAAERLEAALSTFSQLRARPYVERVEAELAACGLTPRGRSDAAMPTLTAREHAVAELVAEGLTNREIAARLFVSAKTVEYHLSNAFTKLGVRSRAQLAASLANPAPVLASRGEN